MVVSVGSHYKREHLIVKEDINPVGYPLVTFACGLTKRTGSFISGDSSHPIFEDILKRKWCSICRKELDKLIK